MSKIVLVEPSRDGYRSQVYLSPEKIKSVSVAENPALLSLASYLIREGHEVKVMYQRTKNNSDFLDALLKEKPEMVGFNSYTFTMSNIEQLCHNIKLRNGQIKTVVGGYHASGFPEMVKNPDIDFGVAGEGELVLTELVDALKGSKDISAIDGLIYLKDSEVIQNPRKKLITNLDSLPFPYRTKESIAECGGLIQVNYSRGCPNACTFCDSRNIWGRTVRWRTPKNVLDEIVSAMEMGAKGVFFDDLTFNLNQDKVFELTKEIKRRKAKFEYSVMCSTKNVSRELLQAMKDSGCVEIRYGIESIERDTRKDVGKNQEFEEALEALRKTREVGIWARGYFMMGYSDESHESLAKLESEIVKLPLDEIRMTFFTPFPTTPLYQDYKSRGLLLTEDFEQYTTDIPVVRTKVNPDDLIRTRERICSKFNKGHASIYNH